MELNNFAHYLCALAVDRLIEHGVDHFFIAPGSRSTPMVSAIVRHASAKKYLGIDERSVGFMALGYGKRAHKPGVVVVTSGTAVSNLYPAITEAFMSSVPLLIITADRPFELRDCGANQTIYQSGMFAHHVVKSYDLAPPNPNVPRESIMAIFEQALRATMGAKKGPVHLNLQLREPLANCAHDGEVSWPTTPLSERMPVAVQPCSMRVDESLPSVFSGKGFIVVGELLPGRGQDGILQLANCVGWPIFADISSNLRLTNHENVIAHYDLKLLNAEFVAALSSFTTVVKFGSRVVSTRLWQMIETLPPSSRCISLDDTTDRIDQTGRFAHVFIGDLPLFLAELNSRVTSQKSTCVLPETAFEDAISSALEVTTLNEAYVAAHLVAQIAEPVNLFLSSGMPIRDVDQFARAKDIPIDVFVNRGASGIDGIMSTTAGLAVADQKPTIVLIGDVAFLHDTNGLMMLKHSQQPVLIVVVNNGGGGIFHFLPIAEETDVITPFLDSPHEVRLDLLCEAHAMAHRAICTTSDFDDALRDFFHTRTTRVVEVHIDRAHNVAVHRAVYQKMATL